MAPIPASTTFIFENVEYDMTNSAHASIATCTVLARLIDKLEMLRLK